MHTSKVKKKSLLCSVTSYDKILHAKLHCAFRKMRQKYGYELTEFNLIIPKRINYFCFRKIIHDTLTESEKLRNVLPVITEC